MTRAPTPAAGRRWALRRASRRLRSSFYARFYRDGDGDPARAVSVAGTARSGTTWLGDLLARGLGARIIFEPFHPELVEEAAPFGLMPYRRPEEDDARLLAFSRTVFGGRVSGPWVDRQANRLRPRGRVVKTVRANLMLGWLARQLPMVPTFLIVRHPAAVVLSRMELGWSADMDVDAMLGNETLVADHLAEHVEWARALTTEEERHALVWAIHYKVALGSPPLGAVATPVFYEDLVTRPTGELARVFSRLDREPLRAASKALRRPSSTASAESAVVAGSDRLRRWEGRLGRDRAARVLGVVERLGVDWLYGAGAVPTAGARERLAVRGADPVPEGRAP